MMACRALKSSERLHDGNKIRNRDLRELREFKSDLNEIESLINLLDEDLDFKNKLISLLHSLENLEIDKEVGEETPYYPYLVTEYIVTYDGYLVLSLSETLGGEVSINDLNEKLINRINELLDGEILEI